MSKQSEAKENQKYCAKAIPQTCCNCKHFKFDVVKTHEGTSFMPNGWYADKNLRCDIGGFAVKKMASCNYFSSK